MTPLFAQEAVNQASLASQVLDDDVLSMFACMTAILVGGGLAVVHMWLRHRERIAMIDRGMNPDDPGSSTQKS